MKEYKDNFTYRHVFTRYGQDMMLNYVNKLKFNYFYQKVNIFYFIDKLSLHRTFIHEEFLVNGILKVGGR